MNVRNLLTGSSISVVVVVVVVMVLLSLRTKTKKMFICFGDWRAQLLFAHLNQPTIL